MEAIDRLGWAAGWTVRAHGVRLGVRATDASVLASARERMPAGWAPSSSPGCDRLFSIVVGGAGPRRGLRRLHVLYGNAQRLARTDDMDELLVALERDAEEWVACTAPRRTFVHAGVVGWEGRAILLPGASGAGKSTLVQALVRAGARYFSDEYALLDERGRVHPYPRPLALRPAAGGVPRRVTADLPDAACEPLPVGLVAFLVRGRGPGLRVRTLSPGKAVLALLAHTLPARVRPRRVLAALERALSEARIVDGSRGEAEASVEPLLEMLAGAAPRTPAAEGPRAQEGAS